MVNLKLKGTDHAELLQIIFQKPFSDCISVSIKYPGLDFVKLSKPHLCNYNVVVQFFFCLCVSPFMQGYEHTWSSESHVEGRAVTIGGGRETSVG